MSPGDFVEDSFTDALSRYKILAKMQIQKGIGELLDHDGDVGIAIALGYLAHAAYRPGMTSADTAQITAAAEAISCGFTTSLLLLLEERDK